MKAPRTVLVACALSCALAGALAIVAPSNAAPDSSAAKPEAGQCRQLTPAQGEPSSNNSPTVSCSDPHTNYTYAVPTVPRRIKFKKISSAQFSKLGLSLCGGPRFDKALGRTDLVRDQTVYGSMFFGPSKAQRADGARWMRCDLFLLAGRDLGELPPTQHPMLQGPITDAVRRCLTHDHYFTTCITAHAYRSVTAFTVHSKKYPTKAQFTAQGRKHCPSSANDFFSWPFKSDWSTGDRGEVCYHATTS